MLELGELLKEGKGKRVYATNDPDTAVVYYKDETVAFHGLKRGRILGKGEVNNAVCKHIFTMLAEKGVENHFIKQLDAAMEMNLPVILHIRDAHGDALDILRQRKGNLPRGVVHCYSGSWESAQEYMNLGFDISFTGSVTFKNAVKLAEVSDKIPLDRLMIETDCPYMAPVPHRGKRNDPILVKVVAQFLADRRGMDVEELARITKENGMRLFGI